MRYCYASAGCRDEDERVGQTVEEVVSKEVLDHKKQGMRNSQRWHLRKRSPVTFRLLSPQHVE